MEQNIPFTHGVLFLVHFTVSSPISFSGPKWLKQLEKNISYVPKISLVNKQAVTSSPVLSVHRIDTLLYAFSTKGKSADIQFFFLSTNPI